MVDRECEGVRSGGEVGVLYRKWSNKGLFEGNKRSKPHGNLGEVTLSKQ